MDLPGALSPFFFRRFLGNDGGRVPYRYERRAVGGWFAEYLSESQFDMLLSLVIVSVGLNVVARSMQGGGVATSGYDSGLYSYGYGTDTIPVSFLTAPATAACLLLLIYIHFEESIRGTSMLKNWNHRYSFQPAAIWYGRDYYRLLTGQLLHGSKFHLYMNVSSLALFGREEYIRRTIHGVPAVGCVIYLLALTLTAGLAHVFLVKQFRYREEMRTYSVGFSGVLFALKVLGNYDRSGMSTIGIPVFADVVAFQIPVEVPTFVQHFFELFIISMVFPRASFWGHLGGIVAGYIFAFMWNIRRIVIWIWTGTLPAVKTNNSRKLQESQKDRTVSNRKLLVEDRGITKRQRQELYYKRCVLDFESEHGETGKTAKALCKKNAEVLSNPFPASVSTFSSCMQELWTGATNNSNGYYGDTIHEDGFEYDDDYEYEDYSEDTDEYRRRRRHSGIGQHLHTDAYGALSLQDTDPLALVKAKDSMTKKLDTCSYRAFLEQCITRDMHYLELFRGEFTLSDRLEMLVNAESLCQPQAEGYEKLLQKEPGSSKSNSGRSKNKALNADLSLSRKMKKTKACSEHLQSLPKEDLEERLPKATTASIKAYCAKQIEFTDCLGLSDDENVHEIFASVKYQAAVVRCIAKVKGGNGLFVSATGSDMRPHVTSSIADTMTPKKAALTKESIREYFAENAYALIVTLVVLVVAQRIFGANTADAEDHRNVEVEVESGGRVPEPAEDVVKDAATDTTESTEFIRKSSNDGGTPYQEVGQAQGALASTVEDVPNKEVGQEQGVAAEPTKAEPKSKSKVIYSDTASRDTENVRQRAALAALARQADRKKGGEESRDRRTKAGKKYSVGLGGGDSRTTYYRGGT